ncbi:hypothetical protein PTKIN_Ptkin07bG0088600 [Pterospermum kingtungense]
MSRSWDIVGIVLISGVSCSAPYPGYVYSYASQFPSKLKVFAYDFGIKHNICLKSYGYKISVVQSTWPAAETLKLKLGGVLFSNGLGQPSAVLMLLKQSSKF